MSEILGDLKELERKADGMMAEIMEGVRVNYKQEL